MRLRVLDTDLFVSDCTSRLPFKFGSVTLREATSCVARIRVEAGSATLIEGFASDLLVPKWFEKNADKSPRQDAEDLLRSALEASRAFVAAGSRDSTVFEIWRQVHADLVQATPADAPDRLVRGFGVALLERTLMDAACRAGGVSFLDALKGDIFGFRPGEIVPELAGWDLALSLPNTLQESVLVRHTVGMADALRASDIPQGDRVEDGLPQALEEDIRQYGVKLFKVKIGGGHDGDVARLLDLAQLFQDLGIREPCWTADGNEQFANMDELADVLEAVQSEPSGRRMLKGLEFIEQPLSRHQTFDETACRSLHRVRAYAPVIIDEADSGLGSFPMARTLGYSGVSVKNCKGVFRAFANRGLCELFGNDCFQSAEDLTNLGGLALQQNLATVAAFGFRHAELNGHHYFRGLDHLPPREAEAAAAAHPELYSRREGPLALSVREGEIQFGSVHAPGYGYAFPVSTEERLTAKQWLEEEHP